MITPALVSLRACGLQNTLSDVQLHADNSTHLAAPIPHCSHHHIREVYGVALLPAHQLAGPAATVLQGTANGSLHLLLVVWAPGQVQQALAKTIFGGEAGELIPGRVGIGQGAINMSHLGNRKAEEPLTLVRSWSSLNSTL